MHIPTIIFGSDRWQNPALNGNVARIGTIGAQFSSNNPGIWSGTCGMHFYRLMSADSKGTAPDGSGGDRQPVPQDSPGTIHQKFCCKNPCSTWVLSVNFR